LISHQIVTVLGNGKLEYLKLNEARVKYAPLMFKEWSDEKEKMVDVKFIDRWIEDEDRAFYENVGFYPEVSLCPPKTYNLFHGFNAERFRPDVPLTKERINELVAPIIYHYDLLTSGHADFIIKWFANIIQFPHIKPDLAILNRDESKLLTEGGGTGKNLGYEWVGNEIIGEDYTIVVGDNEILYGNFNSQFENKLLVFVEEAEGASNFKSQDKLKSKITGKKMNVNKKNVAQYDLDDHARYLFATNNRNPLPIRMGDRRWGVFDVNAEKRGDVEYFEKLVDHLANPEVKWAFYQYLKTVETISSSVKWARSVPITPAYREVRQMNSPLHLKWIVNCLETGNLPNMTSVGDLYNQFRNWASETKQKEAGQIITQTAFGLLLVQEPDIDADYQVAELGTKKRTSAGMYMNWNYDGLVDGLKKLHLLEPDFKYPPDNVCLINTHHDTDEDIDE